MNVQKVSTFLADFFHHDQSYVIFVNGFQPFAFVWHFTKVEKDTRGNYSMIRIRKRHYVVYTHFLADSGLFIETIYEYCFHE